MKFLKQQLDRFLFVISRTKQQFKLREKGDALILTMFILAGMLIVAMSGSYVVLLGIKAAGIQSQSTKAYYVAEAGAEKLLWKLRKNGYQYMVPSKLFSIFSGTLMSGAANYKIYFIDFPPLVFQSVGDYKNSKRSVEIRIGDYNP